VHTVAATLSVTLIGAGLILLGVLLTWVTIVFWRGATEDPEVLASLEVMTDRRFARGDDATRTRLLSQVRSSGAVADAEFAPESYEPSPTASGVGPAEDDTAVTAPLDPLLGTGSGPDDTPGPGRVIV
jgi:hypothetical protein